MKTSIIFIVMAILMIACNIDKTREFIPGTYVNSAESEYSTAEDTLIIEASEGNNYLIHRKTAFRRITDGKPGKQEHEMEEWQAIYDEAKKSLTETGSGKLITFYPDANKLILVRAEFKKIR